MKNISPILVVLLLFFSAAQIYANEITVSAKLNTNSFSLSQVAQLSITVTGTQTADIKIPPVEGIEFNHRGKQHSMQSINGSITLSVTAVYLVHAEKPGDYTVGPIQATVKGETYSSKPVSFQVTNGSAPTSPGNKGRTISTRQSASLDDIAYLRCLPAKKQAYAGESIPVTIKAYFRTNVQNISLPRLDQTPFLMPELNREPEQTREIINGNEYIVLSWNTTLTGIKAGTFLPSFSLDATLLLRRIQRSNDFFGSNPFGSSMFDDFFNTGYQAKQTTISSDKVEITILPLPEKNQPADFNGAVGTFTISTEASPTEITFGDPITLKTTISGKGNISQIQAPAFPETKKIKVYPSSTLETLDERITFERAVIPVDDTVTEIPSLTFSYFDPVMKQYITKTTQPIPIVMKKDRLPLPGEHPETKLSQTTDATSLKTEEKQTLPANSVTLNLVPQHLYMGTTKSEKEVYKRWWFILLFLSGCLLSSLALLHAWQERKKKRNPEYHLRSIRHKEARKAALLLKKCSGSQDISAILLDSTSILREYLQRTEQFGKKDAITATDLDALFGKHSPITTLFTLQTIAQFGGQLPTRAILQETISSIIETLEKKK